jgi:GT2 family glycosyltransferase
VIAAVENVDQRASGEASCVLIGIVTCNRAELLTKAIESGLRQDYRPLRIAVIDDNSSDDMTGVVERFPMVAWTMWDAPRGYLEARNVLMSDAKAEYFLSLDDDAWFMGADEVSQAVEYLESHPRVAVVAFDILSPDLPDERSRLEARPTREFIGCGHMIRLSAVREVGLYTPNPGSYGGEEKDLSLRLQDQGLEIHKLPGVHVWHDKSPVARDMIAQHRSGVCNDLVFAVRRCPLPMLLWVLPYKILSHLRFAVRRRLMRPCIAGMGLFFRNLAATWQSRKPVRASTFREFIHLSRSSR